MTDNPTGQPPSAAQVPPRRKPRRLRPHPDAAPYIWWGVVAVASFLTVIGCSAYSRGLRAESDDRQQRLEAYGVVTPATEVDRSPLRLRYTSFELEYTYAGITRTGTVYTRAQSLGTAPKIWVDPDDPTSIGVPYGAHGSSVTLLPYLTLGVLLAMLTTLVCLSVFLVKSSKPRRARRKRFTGQGGLPQVFEGKIVARRAGASTKATHRERRGELTVLPQGLRFRSLAWRIDPIEIAWSDVQRIKLGRREGLSGGGEIDAAGWDELKFVPTARLRYRSALRHAGLVLHHSPVREDLVEMTPRGSPPSWGDPERMTHEDGPA